MFKRLFDRFRRKKNMEIETSQSEFVDDENSIGNYHRNSLEKMDLSGRNFPFNP
jgi:hypothetical protein